jgi:Protein of unknown function (DUF2911)
MIPGLKPIVAGLLLFTCFSCRTNDRKIPTDNNNFIKPPITLRSEAGNPYQPVDASPMDMSYFPEDFAKVKKGNALPVMRIIYSRPGLNGRTIFGGILEYGKVWRLGANEATEIEFFQPVRIQDKIIPAGRYILYCIPQLTEWTIVLNSDLYSWGLTNHVSKDIARLNFPVSNGQPNIEHFTATFSKTATGAALILAWGEWLCRIPIIF